jgi:hypothetical protein
VTGIIEVRDTGLIERERSRVTRSWCRARSSLDFKWRMLVNAPAATAGGSDVMKMKPEAKLRMKSQIVADAATQPPITPKAFASVPSITGSRWLTPSRSAIPPPLGP